MLTQNIAAIKKTFQLKLNKAPWAEVMLQANDLQDILRECKGLPHNKKQLKALYEIRDMVLAYHGAKPEFNNNLYGVKHEDYCVAEALRDDVLVIKYSFIMLYQNGSTGKPYLGKTDKNNAPKEVTGEIRLMPGN